MPKFRIRSTSNEPSNIEASDWSGAISKIVGRMTGSSKTVNVTLTEDGGTELWADDHDERFVLHTDDGHGSAFEMPDIPTTELWDAPHPGSGAHSARELDPETMTHVREGIAALRQSPSDTEACESALNLLLTHIPAESGSILFAEGGHLRFTSVRGPHAQELVGTAIPINKGIAGLVATSARTMLVKEARQSAQHDASVDHNINHVTRTILAVPIGQAGNVVGVIELLNPFGSDTFLDWHQYIARDVAAALSSRFSVA